MEFPSLSAAIVLSICAILLCIIPSMILHELVVGTVFENRSKTYTKKVKKQIPWKMRISLFYLFEFSDATRLKRRVALYWLYWVANICTVVVSFLSGYGVINHMALLYCAFPMHCIYCGIFIAWRVKRINHEAKQRRKRHH